MQAADDHVTYQIPNDHIRVGYLLTEIKCSEAVLKSMMASIKTDQAPGGLCNNVKASASQMLPYEPVQKKRTDYPKNKRDYVKISELTDEEVEVYAFGNKNGVVKTGVHLWYHDAKNYNDLSKYHKDKKSECMTRTGQGKSKSDTQYLRKKLCLSSNTEEYISSDVTKKVV